MPEDLYGKATRKQKGLRTLQLMAQERNQSRAVPCERLAQGLRPYCEAIAREGVVALECGNEGWGIYRLSPEEAIFKEASKERVEHWWKTLCELLGESPAIIGPPWPRDLEENSKESIGRGKISGQIGETEELSSGEGAVHAQEEDACLPTLEIRVGGLPKIVPVELNVDGRRGVVKASVIFMSESGERRCFRDSKIKKTAAGWFVQQFRDKDVVWKPKAWKSK